MCARKEGERERERGEGGERERGRKEVWSVKRKEGVGRVLQREGGCGRRE